MIGIWSSYSDIYLYVVGVSMLAYGLFLVVAPLKWAKVFHWVIPQEKDLVVALGRTVGLVISLIAIFAFKVITIPAAKPFYFDLLLWILATEALLHLYGAITKTQPKTETIEISLWVVLFVVTLCFYPS